MAKNNLSINELILQELREIKQLTVFQKSIWNLDDFCAYTGISKAYAYQLTSTNQVKFYRPFGKIIFFDREDVMEFLKKNLAVSNGKIQTIVNMHLLKSN